MIGHTDTILQPCFGTAFFLSFVYSPEGQENVKRKTNSKLFFLNLNLIKHRNSTETLKYELINKNLNISRLNS